MKFPINQWQQFEGKKKILLGNGWGKKKKVKVSVTQSYPTLCDPMNYSPPGSSVHGIFQHIYNELIRISSFYSTRSSKFKKDIELLEFPWWLR